MVLAPRYGYLPIFCLTHKACNPTPIARFPDPPPPGKFRDFFPNPQLFPLFPFSSPSFRHLLQYFKVVGPICVCILPCRLSRVCKSFLQFTTGDPPIYPRRLSRVPGFSAISYIAGEADVEGCGGGVVANFKYSLLLPFFFLSFFSPPEAMGLHRVLSSVFLFVQKVN